MQILVCPDDAPAVRRLIEETDGVKTEIVEEAALASGQARICAERRDVAIDAETLLERLRAALSEPEALPRKALANG